MKRFPLPLRIALLLLSSLAVTASAEQGDGGNGGPGHKPHGFGLRPLEKCLGSIGLPSDVQAAAQGVLNAGKPTLDSDGAALKAAHDKLRADTAANAEQSVLGQDLVNQNNARTKLDADHESIKSQVLSKLSDSQQTALNDCMKANAGRYMGRGPNKDQSQPQ